jgi:Cu/Ag efflux pump CusA
LFVLVIFLGNIRAGLLVASVIPLSMLIAVILMNAFGVSGNLMSLGALDFGLIIDGAVIIVEAVLHSLHQHKKNQSRDYSLTEMNEQVKNSASRMMNSAVFGQIIICANRSFYFIAHLCAYDECIGIKQKNKIKEKYLRQVDGITRKIICEATLQIA